MENLVIKKPVIVKSCKWTSINIDEIYEFLHNNKFIEDNFLYEGNDYIINTDFMYYSDIQECDELESSTLYIKTKEGIMKADINDYIMKGVQGEYYPCKEDIYIKTYTELRENITFDFTIAFNLTLLGYHVTRKPWIDSFIYHQKAYPNGITCNEQTANALKISINDIFCCEPYLQKQCIINNKKTHVMYLPSMEDLYANDWMVMF